MKNLRLIIALFFLTGIVVTSFRGSAHQVGDKASDFNLKNVDGKMISLSSVSDSKGYILVFTCNTCPFSKLYEKRIIDLHNKYASKGFPVIAINPNDPFRSPGDSFEEMQAVAEKKNYPFPYLVDKSQEVALAYGATRTPHVFILNKIKSDFKVSYIGAIDDNHRNSDEVNNRYVEKAVDQILSGAKVQTTESKALGCTIKWKDT